MATRLYRAGAFATDTLSDIISLNGYLDGSGELATLRRMGSTSGYQVTTGKIFYVASVQIFRIGSSSASFALGFGYADNDIGFASTTARTNPVAMLGDPEQTTYQTVRGLLFEESSANTSLQFSMDGLNRMAPWKLGVANKYMYYKMMGSAAFSSRTLIVSGFEV